MRLPKFRNSVFQHSSKATSIQKSSSWTHIGLLLYFLAIQKWSETHKRYTHERFTTSVYDTYFVYLSIVCSVRPAAECYAAHIVILIGECPHRLYDLIMTLRCVFHKNVWFDRRSSKCVISGRCLNFIGCFKGSQMLVYLQSFNNTIIYTCNVLFWFISGLAVHFSNEYGQQSTTHASRRTQPMVDFDTDCSDRHIPSTTAQLPKCQK